MVPSASSSQTIRKKDGEKKKVRKKDRKYTQREGKKRKKTSTRQRAGALLECGATRREM